MSRTTLCVVTAATLASLSIGVMVVRYQVMGDEIRAPAGPGTWKVTLLVQGKSTGATRLITACPLDMNRQHVLRESWRSDELVGKIVDSSHRERRQLQWSLHQAGAKGPFRARYEFYCQVDVRRPTSPMTSLGRHCYAPPHAGECLKDEPRVEVSDPAIAALAQQLTDGAKGELDQLLLLYRYVEREVGDDPSISGPGLSAAQCLKNGSGDAAAKSRLLVALCRNRGLPARLVHGLILRTGPGQTAHTWAEVWVHDHWMPLCCAHHRTGRVPPTYLVFGFGDMLLVRGHNVRDLEYACLVERKVLPEEGERQQTSVLWRFFHQIALETIPPGQRHVVEFLLLLPVAALIICVFRNLIGIHSFGTFAPALVGLAFRELRSLPGILVFVSIVLIGWGMRRMLDRYHLLQVPRTAFLLTLVVIVLLLAIMAANFHELPLTQYISLFPMVILTGMIERFWTLETEDSTAASFRTLLGTMLMAATISLIVGLRALVKHLIGYPETLGLVMAAQLLIGRYTGYRLSELFRFRDFLKQPLPGN
jgi:hypothetical protein